MLHMYSSFNLRAGANLDDYRAAVADFSALMKAKGLVLETGPIMTRCRHPIMDTDEDRDHEYFFVMKFRDREQCDAAVRHIQSANPEIDSLHRAIQEDIVDPVFTCWVE